MSMVVIYKKKYNNYYNKKNYKKCFFLQNELPVCLPIFLERLRNEITRLTTVKALTKIASSPLHIDLRPILVSLLKNVYAKILSRSAIRHFRYPFSAEFIRHIMLSGGTQCRALSA